MEEILKDKNLRTQTVTCLSKVGKCYFLEKGDFVHCVNRYRFSQAVLEEEIVKSELFSNRMI